MFTAGDGVATIGVLLALMVPAGRVLALAAIPEAGAAQAASGLWVAFFGPLRVAGLVVAVLWVALALAAVPSDVVRPSALSAGLWDLASQPRARPLAELGRVAVVAIAGVVALFQPGFALSAAMVASGALLLLFAFAGGRQLVQSYLPTEAQGALEDVRVGPVAMVGVRVVVLLMVGVGLAALLLRLRPQAEPVVVASGGACNGAVELCDRPLNRVAFAGAHNAMGSARNPDWLFPNQDLGIPELLNRGVRVFLLDPNIGYRMGNHVKTDFDAVPHANRKVAEVIGQEAWAAGMRVREQLVGESEEAALYLCQAAASWGPSRRCRCCASSRTSSPRIRVR